MVGGESYSVSGSHLERSTICRQFTVRGGLLPILRFQAAVFDFLGGGKVRFSAEGSQLVEGRHLSSVPGEGGFQPIACFYPTRSVGVGFVSGSVVRWSVFLAVSLYRFWSLAMLSGAAKVSCGPSYPGYVIKG